MDRITDATPPEPTDRALWELIDAERHRVQVDDRRRRGRLAQQAAEGSTLADLLEQAAKLGTTVSLETWHRRFPQVAVQEVGTDYAVVADATASWILALGAVRSAVPAGSDLGVVPLAPGGRDRRRLVELLGELAASQVAVEVDTGDRWACGRLVQVGADVVVLESRPGAAEWISLAAVGQVRVVGSVTAPR